jgi:hypothetical protein
MRGEGLRGVPRPAGSLESDCVSGIRRWGKLTLQVVWLQEDDAGYPVKLAKGTAPAIAVLLCPVPAAPPLHGRGCAEGPGFFKEEGIGLELRKLLEIAGRA